MKLCQNDECNFLLRVVAGMVIHVALVLAAFFNIEITYEIVSKFYTSSQDSMFPPRAIATIFAASVFLAQMAGAQWVKSMFIQHFLPEIHQENK